MVGTAPDDPENRDLVHIENNVGPQTESLRFVIERTGPAAKVVWKGKSELTAADLRAPEQARKNISQVDRAREYIRSALAKGPKLVTELVEGGEFTERVLQKAAAGIPHDFRRSAAKAARRAGVPEPVIMAMGGWKTPSMFRRYAIVSSADQRAAVEMIARERTEKALSPPFGPRGPKADQFDDKKQAPNVQ
jgi:integrase